MAEDRNAVVWHAPASVGGYCGAILRETRPHGDEGFFVYADEDGHEVPENGYCPVCCFLVSRYNVEPAPHDGDPLEDALD